MPDKTDLLIEALRAAAKHADLQYHDTGPAALITDALARFAKLAADQFAATDSRGLFDPSFLTGAGPAHEWPPSVGADQRIDPQEAQLDAVDPPFVLRWDRTLEYMLRLRDENNALADVRTLDAMPDCYWTTYEDCTVNPPAWVCCAGSGYDPFEKELGRGATIDEARAKAAAWVREQGQ